jgi:hypothetical protein
MLVMGSLRDLSGDHHGGGMVIQVGRIIILVVLSFLIVVRQISIRLGMELVVVGVFGIVGHGMIVLYKGKGSPAIKRPSGRRGVGNLNRQHLRVRVRVRVRVLVLLTLTVVVMILIIQIIMTTSTSIRLLIAIVDGGCLVHRRGRSMRRR